MKLKFPSMGELVVLVVIVAIVSTVMIWASNNTPLENLVD